MKKKSMFLSALFIVMSLTTQSQEKVNEYHVSPAVTLRMPLQGDSINFKGDMFTIKELLKTPLIFDFKENECDYVEVDTTGYVTMPRVEKDYQVYLFSTKVRTDRFMHAALKVFSPVCFEIYVDGVLKQTNTNVADTVTKIRPVSVPLRMEPQKDYDVLIKLLASEKDKLAPMLKCEFEKDKKFKDATCYVGLNHKRRFSLYETTFGARTSILSLSPNGKYLMQGETHGYSLKNSNSTINLLDMKTKKVLIPNLLPGLRWMPRSNKLYYTTNGENGRNLVLLDPATNTQNIIKKNIPEGAFQWSPTEDFLIYSKTDVSDIPQGNIRRHLMPDDRIPGARNRNYLVKYDLNTGIFERITYGTCSVYLNSISPDGKKLLCISRKPNITEYPFSLNSLIEIDLATLKADTLIREDAYLNSAVYSPDASQLLLIASPEAFGGIGKNCGSLPIANGFDTQAFLMNLSTRQITPITRDFNPSVEFIQWNRTDGCIYFNTTDEDCKHIYRYVPQNGKFEKLPLKEDVINAFSLPQDAPSTAVYIGSGNTSTGVAYSYDMKKQASTLLANPAASKLDEIKFGEMEEWNFTAADGTLVKGMMCLPPDFNPEKKYPLIVYYYGGTTPTTRGMTSPYSAQLFASRDYVVYVIQPSGAIGFGQEFSARHVNAWGDWTADEIIEGTKKFCEAHPFVDSKKIGCIGASYGGFMTQYLQTKTDIFAAAVSHAGISNVTSYWGEGYWGYSYNSIAAAGSYPWNNPDLFVKHGSLFNADKINTPLLLLHGTVDTNVPIGESIQLYNALKILGKPVEYITVAGENHFISDYNNRVLWHNTIMAWFARWLQDRPEWWNELYPSRNW